MSQPGNVLTEQPAPGARSKIIKIALVALFVVLLGLIIEGVYFYTSVYTPRKEAAAYTVKTIPAINDLVTQIGKVNDSLVTISDFIKSPAPQKEPDKSATIKTDDLKLGISSVFPKNSKGQVAGAKQSILDNLLAFVNPFENFKNQIVGVLEKTKVRSFGKASKEKVAGESDIEDPTTTKIRQLKEMAIKGEGATSDGKKKAESLKTIVTDSKIPTLAKDVNQSVRDNLTETETYLSESEKISKYYNFISGIQLELNPALKSLASLIINLIFSQNPDAYLGKIDELSTTLVRLGKSVETYPASSIPTGFSNLHEDNVKVFKILGDYLAGIKKAVLEKDFPTLAQASEKFSSDIEILSTRAKTAELSFWQDNKTIRSYSDLSSKFQAVKKDLESLERNSKVSIF